MSWFKKQEEKIYTWWNGYCHTFGNADEYIKELNTKIASKDSDIKSCMRAQITHQQEYKTLKARIKELEFQTGDACEWSLNLTKYGVLIGWYDGYYTIPLCRIRDVYIKDNELIFNTEDACCMFSLSARNAADLDALRQIMQQVADIMGGSDDE